ncbi:mannose-6-phosphate isomerase, class I [Vibrio fluvialis]
MALFKLDNVIQNYAWGSKSALTEMFGIANPQQQPQAEIWMGAHPNGCAKVHGTGESLADLLAKNGKRYLGEYTAARFAELPFLLKVLSAEAPLSIQVHPNKRNAEIGFERENQQGIALNSPQRNYKDANHKPELVYALTFYRAMNGFRPIPDIIELFGQISIQALEQDLARLESQPTNAGLKVFFTTLMTMNDERKTEVLQQLKQSMLRPAKTSQLREALQYIEEFEQLFPHDIGLLAPLFLNTVELAPGEAMFLHAETPHAYVRGTALEIMANSDNVLRAGLTPKHIDVAELIRNTSFDPMNPQEIKLASVHKDGKQSYPVPVDDFAFDILTVTDEIREQYIRSAEILFCIDGQVNVTCEERTIVLSAGESAFISNDALRFSYAGQGTLARAYN